MTTTIPTVLIERALALTGKTTELYWLVGGFDYPKFFYYLLSPEFIRSAPDDIIIYDVGYAIYEFQRRDKEYPEGNPEPIISLLSKIG